MKKERKFFWAAAMGIFFLIAICGFFRREVVYQIGPKSEKGFFSNLESRVFLAESGEKIIEIKKWVMREDEANIFLKAPPNFKKYKKLEVDAVFQNPDAPILKIGIRKKIDYDLGEPLFSWKYHFLVNKYLDHFPEFFGENWSVISDKKRGLSLFQKIKKYRSVADFLKNPPTTPTENRVILDEFGKPKNEKESIISVATLDAKIPENPKIPENVSENSTRIFFAFRGNFSVFLPLDPAKNQNLSFDFWKQDLNQFSGKDRYEMRLFDPDGNLVEYKILDDDGDAVGDRRILPQKFAFDFPIEKKGIYRLEFRLREKHFDAILRNFTFRTPFVFFNNFRVVDNPRVAKNLAKSPFSFVAGAGEIRLKAIPGFSQEILIGDQKEKLENDEKTFLLKRPTKITLSKNNVEVSADSPVGFSEKTFFDLFPQKSKPFSGPFVDDEIEFLLSGYSPVLGDKTTRSQKVFFSLEKVVPDQNGNIWLRLRAPGLFGKGDEILFSELNFRFLP